MRPLAQSERDVRFWVGHAVVGVSVAVIGSLTGLTYLLLTPEGQHRRLLIAVTAVCLATAPTVLALPHRRIALNPRGAWFWYSWGLFFCGILTAFVMLDGGSSSPLVYFFPVAMVMSAIAFSRRGVLLLGACLTTAERMRELIADADKLAASLAEQARLDGLTGCLNHRAFHERLDTEITLARRYGNALALVVVDLDEFKSVNDDHGHLHGDTILQRVAGALMGTVRECDAVARIGGDEFAVIAPGTGDDAIDTLALRIRGALTVIDGPSPVHASVGTAVWSPEIGDGRLLFLEADQALYRAKRTGREPTATL